MQEKSIYIFYPLLILALGTKDVKSSLMTLVFSMFLFSTTFVLKKIFKSENLFFIRFFMFVLQISIISSILAYLSFEWYIVTKYAVIMFFSIYIIIERIKIPGKLIKIKYMTETAVLIIILGILRELLSFGSVFSIKVIDKFDGILLFNYSSGGFFLSVILLACFDYFKNKEAKNAQRDF